MPYLSPATKYALCFPYSISGLEATGAAEGQYFALEAVLEMIVEPLKWMQALDFQKDGLLISLQRGVQALLVFGCFMV